ncbi:MAG: hypothetical protein ACTSWY_14035 [Promethearchaeota archaeon]
MSETEKIEIKEKPKLKGTPKKITCFGCSLLCDDIYVELDSDENLIRTVNSCFRGTNFLKSYKTDLRFKTSIQKNMGLFMNIPMDESLEIFNKEIKNASNITFYGMGAISYNSQIAVMRFIKRLLENGKTVNIKNFSNLIRLTTKYGLTLTSIGQAINNADIFIFWKTDATHSHPKLTGKLLFSRGFFRSTGKEVKKFILIENKESDLTRLKDLNIDDSGITPVMLTENISKLLDPKNDGVVKFEGMNDLNTNYFKNYLLSTEYGVLITTVPFEQKKSDEWLSQIGNLLKILNKKVNGRFSLLPLTVTSNELGQSMAALSEFSADEIKQLINPTDSSIDPDLAIIFGGEYLRDEYKIEDYEYPEKRIILFDNFKSNLSKRAKVTIPYAIPGIECESNVVRFDGVNINVEKWSDPPKNVRTIEKIFNETTI